MPENNEQTPATPEVVNTPQQTVEAPNAANRQEVYERIYGSAAPQASAPQQAAPAPQPQQNQVVVDANALQALVAEVQALKAHVAAPPQQAVAVEPPKPDWFNLLQDGKRTEAEATLIDKVATGASDKITQEAVRQAFEVMQANQDINNYNTQVKIDNPDLLDVENLVVLQAEQYFRSGQAAGRIKSTKDFTDLYKESVSKAVDSIRTTLQRTRAVAKAEERVVRQQVLNSYTVPPNKIVLDERSNQPSGQQAETLDTSLESYMAARRQAYSDSRLTPDVRKLVISQRA